MHEADPWRSANKGIEYNQWVLNSWIYDGNPLVHLKYEDNLNRIKSAINNGYFESFIEKNMINNPHCSLVVLTPKNGLEYERNKALEEKLERYRKSLSEKELKDLIERNDRLKAAQVRLLRFMKLYLIKII